MHRAVTLNDIVEWICINYPVQPNDVQIDDGLPGTVKITVEGISKQEQLEIHEGLQELLPAGIAVDVHRGRDRPSETPININRPPVWDVED